MSPRGLVAAFSRFSRPARRQASHVRHVRERHSGRPATRAPHLAAELLESRCMLSATARLENNISMFDRIPVIHGSQPASPGGSFVGQFFWNGSGFKSFCVEGQQSISPGLHTFPTVTSLSASGLANAGLVEQFWQSYGPTTPGGFTSITDAAAFQLGLWELISDGPSRDLKSGSFRVGDSASPAIARAASWLDGTGTPAPGAGGSVALHVMQHPTKQDQVIWGPLPPPSVSVKVTPTSVTEDGSKQLTYEFTASPAPTADIAVNYRIGGSAQAGSDFTGLPQGATTGTITIPAGSTSATLTIVPTPDTEIEPDETVVITLQNGTGYSPGTSVATGTILNDDLPAVALAVSPAGVTEDGTTNLVYTFTRTGPTTSGLTVNYVITGTADDTDYSGATPGTGKKISFAAGSATATVTIDPTADTEIERDETVILTLASGSGYTVGTTTPVTGMIENDDYRFELRYKDLGLSPDRSPNGNGIEQKPYRTYGHWVDNNNDGVIQPGQEDMQLPAAFLRATKGTVDVRVIPISDPAAVLPDELELRGFADDGITFPATPAKRGADGVFNFVIEASHAFRDTVWHYDDFAVRWQIRVPGGGWRELGTSRNDIYLTLAEAFDDDPLPHTLVHIGSKYGSGSTTRDELMKQVWTYFQTLRVSRQDETHRIGSRDLEQVGGPFRYWSKYVESGNLWLAGSVNCGSVSELFLASLAVQGVQEKSNLLRFLSPEAIVVNQWTTNGKPLVRGNALYDALIYNYVGHADDFSRDDKVNGNNTGYNISPSSQLLDAAGTKGQNSDNPVSIFFGHTLVQLTIAGKVRWLDPSYGVEYVGDSNDERLMDFENRMLYGFLEGLASDLEVALDRDLNNDGRITPDSGIDAARMYHYDLVRRQNPLKAELEVNVGTQSGW